MGTFRVFGSGDGRDDPFRPRKGIFGTASVDFAYGGGALVGQTTVVGTDRDATLPVDVGYTKVAGLVSGYIPLADRFTLALTARGGQILSFSDDGYVPLFKRFYLGGTGSVRGFSEDQILPADDPDWPADQTLPDDPDVFRAEGPALPSNKTSLGGNFFFNGRSELRFPLIGDLEAGIFFDVGQLLEDTRAFQISQFAAGTGAGLRYLTPIGPLVIDLGMRVLDGQRRLIFDPAQAFRIHFSIGYM
jgi:outer membrane protein assembly factor BamA